MRYGLFATAFLVLFLPAALHAQWSVEAGAGWNTQGGTFTAPCGCQYQNGSGLALRAAVSSDLISLMGLSIGVKSGIDYKQFSSSHIYATGTGPGSSISGYSVPIDSINIDDNGDFTTTYLTVAPYARYKIPVVGLTIEAAAGIDYLLSSHFLQTWSIANAFLAGKQVSGVKYASTGLGDTIPENGPIQNLATTRYSALISLGYPLNFMGLDVSPTITADIPISNIRSANSNDLNPTYWHVATYYASVAVRFGQ